MLWRCVVHIHLRQWMRRQWGMEDMLGDGSTALAELVALETRALQEQVADRLLSELLQRQLELRAMVLDPS